MRPPRLLDSLLRRRLTAGRLLLVAVVLLRYLDGTTLYCQDPVTGSERIWQQTAPWPPSVTVVLMAFAVLYFGWLYLHEQSSTRKVVKLMLAAIRVALVAIVLWMMYGATVQPFRTDLPDIMLFLDDSGSMSTRDVSLSPTDRVGADIAGVAVGSPPQAMARLEFAKSLFLQRDAELAKFLTHHYQVRLVTVATPTHLPIDSTQSLSQALANLQESAPSSPLGTLLRDALRRQRGRPLAAVVLASDGISTEGPPLSEVAIEAAQRGVPLHVIGVGSEELMRDLRLSDLITDEAVLVGDLVTFDVTLHASGFGGETVQVILRRIDDANPIDTQAVTLTDRVDSQRVRLVFQAETEGTQSFLIEVVGSREPNLDNNAITTQIVVRTETTKVLFVQSYPSYEFHYLKTLFERLQQVGGGESQRLIDFNVLLQEADPEYADIDVSAIPRFPGKEALFQYDVVIFGDVNPTYLGTESLRHVRDFVREQGHGFIGIAGPRYFPAMYANTPLAEILPFDVQNTLSPPVDLPIEIGFRPILTELGVHMPAMQLDVRPEETAKLWSQLPECYWLLEIDKLKSGVRVLGEHPTRQGGSGRPLPVMTLSYVGAGNVFFQATDDSWRWRIGSGDAKFARYWTQVVRYMGRHQLRGSGEVVLLSDRAEYQHGDTVRLRARFADETRAPDDGRVVVMVQQQGRSPQRLTLARDSSDRGLFVADLAHLSSGEFHAWMVAPTLSDEAPAVDFSVAEPLTEMSRLARDTAELRQAAERSGGKYYEGTAIQALMNDLPVGRQVRIESLTPIPMWNRWPLALLFVVLLGCEWLLRRLLGMV